MDDLLKMIFDSVTQHIPHDAVWIAYAGTAGLALFGLLLLAKGAKLAPLMSALAFLGIGGIAGSFVAYWLGTPAWVTIGVAGVVGFGLGLVLFKVWLAVLVASCFVGCSLSLYGVKVLTPHLASYASSNYNVEDAAVGVTLPSPGGADTVSESTQAELGQIWSYLGSEVPSFLTSFWAIVISTGLAGLILGLLLPRFSRALLAATAGTFLFLTAVVAALGGTWPGAMEWIGSIGAWQWVIIVVIWGASLGYNLLDLRGKHPKGREESEEAIGEPATA